MTNCTIKKILSRFSLIGVSLGLIIGLTGGGIYLVSEILYGDYPKIAFVLGQSGLVIFIIISITNLIYLLIESYKTNW